MRVKQISVFLENKAGRLSEVTAILAEAGINIRALSVADTSDFGVLRLIVNDNQKALEPLKIMDFQWESPMWWQLRYPINPGGFI